ncbi:hypothetical protein WICMUC_004577 [Wickerhamomyces mucosus]|uniref:Uncharacterized protein n=1 Tax=Wickerhamomyces mucosus TaxID=1378264 RepID=A0A9P8TB51_9ASCO|nr:hypothetical protein WICMUC_004577 [Wickerhamomyces mucosus]
MLRYQTSNNIDSILSNGSIQFTNGIIIESNKSILLLSGQILELEINYNDKIINRNEIDIRGLNFLKLINPLPDLLVIGTGKYFRKISMNNINFLQIELGLKLEISNSINAIKNFDLLSKERFNGSIMGLILPLNEGGFNK